MDKSNNKKEDNNLQETANNNMEEVSKGTDKDKKKM